MPIKKQQFRTIKKNRTKYNSSKYILVLLVLLLCHHLLEVLCHLFARDFLLALEVLFVPWLLLARVFHLVHVLQSLQFLPAKITENYEYYSTVFKSSHSHVLRRITVLKNLAKYLENHLGLSSLLNQNSITKISYYVFQSRYLQYNSGDCN